MAIAWRRGVESAKTRVGVILAGTAMAMSGCAAPERPVKCADDAIARLDEGNSRFRTDHRISPHSSAKWRRKAAVEGQHPFAIILSCSDSRVPVELIFDQGVGDLFVLRDAGNISGVDEVGTIEYAVEHLKPPLVVVLGHYGCGAVSAAVHHEKVHGDLALLLDHIAPAVAAAEAKEPKLSGDALMEVAVEENVRHSIHEIFEHSPDIRKAVASGSVRFVGAIYDIASGEVHWLK